jgi:hypothetical protein
VKIRQPVLFALAVWFLAAGVWSIASRDHALGVLWLITGASWAYGSTRPPRRPRPEPESYGAPVSKDPDDYRNVSLLDRRRARRAAQHARGE